MLLDFYNSDAFIYGVSTRNTHEHACHGSLSYFWDTCLKRFI